MGRHGDVTALWGVAPPLPSIQDVGALPVPRASNPSPGNCSAPVWRGGLETSVRSGLGPRFRATRGQGEVETGEGDEGSKKTSFQEGNTFDNRLCGGRETSQNDAAGRDSHRHDLVMQ